MKFQHPPRADRFSHFKTTKFNAGKYIPMTPKRTHWLKSTCLLVLIGCLEVSAACSWTPQVETVVHDSPKGTVTLRTIRDDSLPTDHPVKIQNATMERILRGAHKFRDVRLIENLIGGDPKPTRLFSQSQITFLAPLLTSALAQATPEEEVFFQCTAEVKGMSPIEGHILVHDSTLFFTWEEPLSKPTVLAKQHRATSGLPDPSMPQEHTIMFFPTEALRVENDSTNSYIKRLGENTVAIDYLLLAGLPKSVFEIPELQDKDEKSSDKDGSSEKEPVSTELGAPETPITAGSPDKTKPDALSESSSGASSDIRALKEQMEKLQKEVEKQQEELERLKKEKP